MQVQIPGKSSKVSTWLFWDHYKEVFVFLSVNLYQLALLLMTMTFGNYFLPRQPYFESLQVKTVSQSMWI